MQKPWIVIRVISRVIKITRLLEMQKPWIVIRVISRVIKITRLPEFMEFIWDSWIIRISPIIKVSRTKA
jgi:hypothetical protein